MRAVNTVSLNGNAWQIESEGCEALTAYLRGAELRLQGDPDRDEILADLEQAIADKLARYVSAHKNVVSAQEIALALKEMGPVETGAQADARPHSTPEPEPGTQSTADAGPGATGPGGTGPGRAGFTAGAAGVTRHLFQIREGAMVSGVCNGLAAYFSVDVTLVRVLFVVFTVLTGGVGGVVYLVMMIVVPVAVTSEQMAAAHGKPFSAEELIGRPQAAFGDGRHWRQQWRDQRRMWREQRRQWRRQRRAWNGVPHPGHFGPGPMVGGPITGLLRALLLIAFLVALVGATKGVPLMGWDWGTLVPRWVGIVAVCVIYGTLMKQIHMAQYYGHMGAHNPGYALLGMIGALTWLLVLVFLGWYVVHHWPQVQDFFQRALQAIQSAFDDATPRNSVNT
jgi:phage shock protein PspC (stress-responsive transcriptional regulator)